MPPYLLRTTTTTTTRFTDRLITSSPPLLSSKTTVVRTRLVSKACVGKHMFLSKEGAVLGVLARARPSCQWPIVRVPTSVSDR